MIYISYQQLLSDLANWDEDLPRDIDAVCSIPRSGNVPGSVLALRRNIQWTTVDGLSVGSFNGGYRNPTHKVRKVLVVDDSLLSGKAMKAAAKQLASVNCDVIYSAVYVKPGNDYLVDYHYKTLETPRLFEWNVFHSYWAKRACLDIDGVLCRDPLPRENDDGAQYELFLKTAEPRFIPSVKVAALVTSRLERYRGLTERWLHRYGVQYGKLIMHPARNKKERMRAGNHALRKAEVYRDERYELFIESSERQARSISKITRKPVLCTDTNELYCV